MERFANGGSGPTKTVKLRNKKNIAYSRSGVLSHTNLSIHTGIW